MRRLLTALTAIALLIGLPELALHLRDATGTHTTLIAEPVPFLEFVAQHEPDVALGRFAGADVDARLGRTPPPGARVIWFFGGSTMEGERNDTIPRFFTERCDTMYTPCTTRNWGQSGWQLSNEKYLFTELLAAGERPDVAIFYDGVNELESGPYKAKPSQVARVYEALFHHIFDIHAVEKGLYRRRFKLGWAIDAFLNQQRYPAPSDDNAPRLITAPVTILDAYRHQRRVTEALCRAESVTCLFVWQPELSTKAPLSPDEVAYVERTGDFVPERHDVQLTFAAAADLKERPNHLDLSNLFSAFDRTIYTDHCHVTAESRANAVIAERIHRFVFEGVKDETPARVEDYPSDG